MVFESALLAFPLLALSRVVGQYLPLSAPDAPWQGGVVFAIGAGVYEELVFRLAAFTILNIMLVDLLRLEKTPAYLLILVASSVLFASYHYWSPMSAPFRWPDYIFRAAAGIYFGALFMVRGFGVTAGCHAAYDIYYFVCRALE
jgi:membrane protease YdiL (CAAX protease family)